MKKFYDFIDFINNYEHKVNIYDVNFNLSINESFSINLTETNNFVISINSLYISGIISSVKKYKTIIFPIFIEEKIIINKENFIIKIWIESLNWNTNNGYFIKTKSTFESFIL